MSAAERGIELVTMNSTTTWGEVRVYRDIYINIASG
jgi:hypothetical protein